MRDKNLLDIHCNIIDSSFHSQLDDSPASIELKRSQAYDLKPLDLPRFTVAPKPFQSLGFRLWKYAVLPMAAVILFGIILFDHGPQSDILSIKGSAPIVRLFAKSKQGKVREIMQGDVVTVGEQIQFKVKTSRISLFYSAVISQDREILMPPKNLKSNGKRLEALREYESEVSFELDAKPVGEILSLLFCSGKSWVASNSENTKLVLASFQKENIKNTLPNCERLEWLLR